MGNGEPRDGDEGGYEKREQETGPETGTGSVRDGWCVWGKQRASKGGSSN